MGGINLLSLVSTFCLNVFSLLCFPLRCLIRKIREYRVAMVQHSYEGNQTLCPIKEVSKCGRSSSMNRKKRQRFDSFCIDHSKISSGSPGKRRRLESRSLYGAANQSRLQIELNECTIPLTAISKDLAPGAYLCHNGCEEQSGNSNTKDLLTVWSRCKLPMSFAFAGHKYLPSYLQGRKEVSVAEKKVSTVNKVGQPFLVKDAKQKGTVVPRDFLLCRSNTLGENQLQLVSRKKKVSSGLATRSPLRNLNTINSSMVSDTNSSSSPTGIIVTQRSRIPRRTTAV